MNFDLKGKRVLITGASRGIGKATAILMSKNGAEIILHYASNRKKSKETFQLLTGENHHLVQCDFKSPDAIESFFQTVIHKVSGIDILINNAGIYEEKPLVNAEYSEWKELWNNTLNVNLTSVAHLSFLAAKLMKTQGGGKIINVSSRGAFRGEPDAIAYGASKGGLNSLGQSMSKALAPHGVMVYTVAPGFVETEMSSYAMKGERAQEIIDQNPLGRIAKAEEVAQTICYLAADGNDFLTGGIIDINGASYLR
jgi:3-oxoacyl-[acyl-carrier protein] reductase